MSIVIIIKYKPNVAKSAFSTRTFYNITEELFELNDLLVRQNCFFYSLMGGRIALHTNYAHHGHG